MRLLPALRAGILLLTLLLPPAFVCQAAEEHPSASPASNQPGNFQDDLKRHAKAAGAFFKDRAHRVAVASKAVAHEVATTAKRGAAETRAAFKGKTPAPSSTVSISRSARLSTGNKAGSASALLWRLQAGRTGAGAKRFGITRTRPTL